MSRMSKVVTGLATIACLLVGIMLDAQPPGRGGDTGGRGGGGRGGFSGGGGRGGFGGGGGRGGGGDFRQRMLERMDSNGNGSLDQNEVGDRARGFIEGMARTAGLELKYPMSISRLTGSSSSGRSSRGSDRGRTQREDDENEYPLIEGFGDESIMSFGMNPNQLNGRIVDVDAEYDSRVLQSADRSLERYDKDESGVLEYEEWADARWSFDPRDADSDDDGRLTRAEMAEQYKSRASRRDSSRGRGDTGRGDTGRGDTGRGNSSRGGFGSLFGGGGSPFGGGRSGRGGDAGGRSSRGGVSGRSGRGGPGGGGPTGGGRGFDPSAMLRRFDTDGDGKIKVSDLDERMQGIATRMIERAGMDPSKTVDLKRLAKGKTDKSAVKETPSSKTIVGSERFGGRSSYRKEKVVPKGLPSWWDSRDEDADGQVTLSEYFTSRSNRKRSQELTEFEKLDQNQDGIITTSEAADD